MIYRETNSACLLCGGQYPSEIDLVSSNGYTRYVCPKCSDTIMEKLRAEDGECASSPAPLPFTVHDIHLPDEITWQTWEVWWTDHHFTMRIHGRFVHGNKAFDEYVDTIQEQVNE